MDAVGGRHVFGFCMDPEDGRRQQPIFGLSNGTPCLVAYRLDHEDGLHFLRFVFVSAMIILKFQNCAALCRAVSA